MSLLQLPPETLIQVMDLVGSSYFREDLGRLAVCKQWFIYARAVCLKDIQLSQKTLRRLLSSRDVAGSLVLVKDSLETLNLKLNGFEDWSSISVDQDFPQDVNALDASSWDSRLGRAILAAWTIVLDRDLAQLANIARESRKLKVISIQALSERHPMLPHLPRRDYLSLVTMQALLSVENLMVLELDVCGTMLAPRQERRDDFHICKRIGALLTTLRRLRLRMRSICPDALRPQHNHNSLRLREVLVNLSLSNESPTIMSAVHSTRCGATGGGFLKLRADIEDQAEALAARMASPKAIRILTHTLPQLTMRSLDVLTSRRMILADDAAWEDDGEIIEEDSSSETEVLDDGFSTSSDE